MTQPDIKALLDKYWQAETTLEEEQQLAAYFRQPDTDPAFESYRAMFAWREEEAQWRPGADFDSRILQRIESEEGVQTRPPAQVRSIRSRSVGYAAAAAVILCIGISFFLSIGSGSNPGIRDYPGDDVVASVPDSAVMKSPGNAVTKSADNIKDTYDDPQKALAAVRHALLIASARISQGRHITQKNIARLHNSWQAATGD